MRLRSVLFRLDVSALNELFHLDLLPNRGSSLDSRCLFLDSQLDYWLQPICLGQARA